MARLARATSTLLLIDFQQRLMPAIDKGAAVLANAVILGRAAAMLDVPVLRTEQYPKGLGATVPPLADFGPAIEKITFDACGADAFMAAIPTAGTLVIAGCEAHVCVLQSVLGLLEHGRAVAVVADAIGSRQPESRLRAIDRMAAHGADIVTTEMAVFEWLDRADIPPFKAVSALIR